MPTTPGPLARFRKISPRHRVPTGHRRGRLRRRRANGFSALHAFVADALVGTHGVSPDRILLLPNAVDADRFGSNHARARPDAPCEGNSIQKPNEFGSFLGRDGSGRAFRPCWAPSPGRPIRDSALWVVGRDNPAPWQKMAVDLGVDERVRFSWTARRSRSRLWRGGWNGSPDSLRRLCEM